MCNYFPVPKRPRGPANSTTCPQPPPKSPQRAKTACTWAAESPTPKTKHILCSLAPNAICNAPNPPSTTHLWWFQPLKISLTDVSTPYLGPVGCGKLQEVAHRGGCQIAQQGRAGAKNDSFQKITMDHMECQKKWFWCVLNSWCPVLALVKSQDALKEGRFKTKMGQKIFQK